MKFKKKNMSRNQVNKRSFQEFSNGADRDKNKRNKPSGWKKYSARDKSRWPELLQMRDRKLRAEKLTYLLDPNEIAKIKAPVEKPVFEHFRPTLADPTESEEAKSERDMINDVAKSVYKDALSRKIKEVKDLQDDFERYLSIIFEDLVDKRICDELHDFVQIKCLAMTPEQRLHVVFEHLLSTHGPHSNLDVTQLTARVTELSPNTMGWAKYLPEFMHAVTTLASMKQRDPSTNEVIRGPKPAPNPVPHQPLTGDPAQDNIILRNHYTATLAEQERVDKAWPLGGPELNYKPPDSQLKSALLQWVKTDSHMAINKIYADSLEHPTWTWDTIYDKLKMVVDDMSNGINPGGYRDRDRAAADAAKADKEGVNKLIRQLKKCRSSLQKTKTNLSARTAK